MVTCGGCGREMRAGNLARHQRGACRVWDPGGGANPWRGSTAQWMDGWTHSEEEEQQSTSGKKRHDN